MIPEKLHLLNFLSHRDTVLDFRGIHVASLVGDNGAGKSALLDAITWSVWGRSRAPYGREDDLVFHGEDHIEVEFEFLMPYQGGKEQRFRILRRREHRGRRTISTQLDFQIQGESGWSMLTAENIRETQSRIIEHLGLDYDTFINSAYLRQGHADEFTVQTPAQRKRVLSAVLELDRWTVYQERAKSILSVHQGELKATDERLEEINSELAHKPEYEQALLAAEEEVTASEAQLQEIQAQFNNLTRTQEQAAGLQRQIENLHARTQQETERLERLVAERRQLIMQLELYKDLLTQAPIIEKQYQEYQDFVSNERILAEKLGEIAQLQQQKSKFEQDLANARAEEEKRHRDCERDITRLESEVLATRSQLERELGELQSQIHLLEERMPGTETIQALDANLQRLRELTLMKQERETLTTQLHSNDVEQSRLNELNRQYRNQMNEAKSRLDALKSAAAVCPLCGQALSDKHRDQLLEEISVEGNTLGDGHRSNTGRIEHLNHEHTELNEQIKSLELELRLLPAQEQRVARLRQQIEQGEQAQTRISQLHKRVQNLEIQLAEQDYAHEAQLLLQKRYRQLEDIQNLIDNQQFEPDIRLAIARLNTQIEKIAYSASDHQRVSQSVQELRHAEKEFHELENARAGSHREQARLERLGEDIDGQKRNLELLSETYTRDQAQLDELQPILLKGPALSRQLAEIRNLAINARQKLGGVKQNLASLDTLEHRASALRKSRSGLVDNINVYTELREAFGVNGIPAMIIEHTLPELETEANRILQQLTGGRMHVRFDTQRETKTGHLRETLDIIISDEKGTRPYENFSGGEQFRINFAIRVALSQLLARRSGVRLRSLFVDEGFGALDADGRQKLVEAVKTVQDSFQLILVITHIDELREAFPTQLLVTKSDAGSIVEVA
ncbi:MAG: SMC family ATPase [Anaerolineae bacterium]|nr:SMC family ATPase [Anaerolineae bacterium]